MKKITAGDFGFVGATTFLAALVAADSLIFSKNNPKVSGTVLAFAVINICYAGIYLRFRKIDKQAEFIFVYICTHLSAASICGVLGVYDRFITANIVKCQCAAVYLSILCEAFITFMRAKCEAP